jgi:saccharopine dehydrogenase (NAD+, L-lysine forming)
MPVASQKGVSAMRVLQIGVGGVGESVARIAQRRDPKGDWLESLVLADYDEGRAVQVAAKLGDAARFPAVRVDATRREEVEALVAEHKPDLLMNLIEPKYNPGLMDIALECGLHYMDTGSCSSEPHPTDPFHEIGLLLGARQWEKKPRWDASGLMGLLGFGVEPGMSDFFARFAEKHLFDEIDEIGVRDGGDLSIPGHEGPAFGFNVWSTVEECLDPPIVWEKGRGHFTTEPFSEPETFWLPEGIGAVEMVNVEHSEPVFIPRVIGKGLKRVTFKYALGEEFIEALKVLHACNLDSKRPVPFAGRELVPLDALGAIVPSPAETGLKMVGRTAAGTWVRGRRDGLEREVYLYQVADNQECVERLGCQAVVAQTAFTPVIVWELMAAGRWEYPGLRTPEMCDPDAYVALMADYGFAPGLLEMDSDYKRAGDRRVFERLSGGPGTAAEA